MPPPPPETKGQHEPPGTYCNRSQPFLVQFGLRHPGKGKDAGQGGIKKREGGERLRRRCWGSCNAHGLWESQSRAPGRKGSWKDAAALAHGKIISAPRTGALPASRRPPSCRAAASCISPPLLCAAAAAAVTRAIYVRGKLLSPGDGSRGCNSRALSTSP